MDINGPTTFAANSICGPYTLEYVEKLSRERGQLYKTLCNVLIHGDFEGNEISATAYEDALKLLATIKI